MTVVKLHVMENMGFFMDVFNFFDKAFTSCCGEILKIAARSTYSAPRPAGRARTILESAGGGREWIYAPKADWKALVAAGFARTSPRLSFQAVDEIARQTAFAAREWLEAGCLKRLAPRFGACLARIMLGCDIGKAASALALGGKRNRLALADYFFAGLGESDGEPGWMFILKYNPESNTLNLESCETSSANRVEAVLRRLRPGMDDLFFCARTARLLFHKAETWLDGVAVARYSKYALDTLKSCEPAPGAALAGGWLAALPMDGKSLEQLERAGFQRGLASAPRGFIETMSQSASRAAKEFYNAAGGLCSNELAGFLAESAFLAMTGRSGSIRFPELEKAPASWSGNENRDMELLAKERARLAKRAAGAAILSLRRLRLVVDGDSVSLE